MDKPMTAPTREPTWIKVADRHPPAHARYEVRLKDYSVIRLATPCYGMHMPWWVPFADGKESAPVDMRDDDEWRAVDAWAASRPEPAADALMTAACKPTRQQCANCRLWIHLPLADECICFAPQPPRRM